MTKLLFTTTLFIISISTVFSQDASTFLHIPKQIAIDSKDNIYVLFQGGIARLTPDGKMKILSQVVGSLIAIDSKDNVYLAGNSNIKRMFIDANDNFRFEFYAGDINYDGAEDGDLLKAKFKSIQSIAF